MLERITNPRISAVVFCTALLLFYALVPFALVVFLGDDPSMRQLAVMCPVSCACIMAGFHAPLLDRRFASEAWRLQVNSRHLHFGIWSGFALFVLIVFLTAEETPLMTALSGAGSAEVGRARGAFFKLRTGWEAALPYLETLFTGVLIPYSLGLLFIQNARLRWTAFVAFLLFTLSFMQKALFVRATVPLFYLWVQNKIASQRNTLIIVLAASFVMLPFVMTMVERGDWSQTATTTTASKGGGSRLGSAPQGVNIYFSSDYTPTGTIDYVVWRVGAVPVFTASDSLRVFEEKFGGQPLLGATSTLLAAIFGVQRVPFESLVFEHQWSKSDIGRSNTVYFIEGYINFGWAGVLIFSLFVGQCLRWFWKSEDFAFKAIWLLFLNQLFASGLIGTLLSNGYVLLFLFALFCVSAPSRPSQAE